MHTQYHTQVKNRWNSTLSKKELRGGSNVLNIFGKRGKGRDATTLGPSAKARDTNKTHNHVLCCYAYNTLHQALYLMRSKQSSSRAVGGVTTAPSADDDGQSRDDRRPRRDAEMLEGAVGMPRKMRIVACQSVVM